MRDGLQLRPAGLVLLRAGLLYRYHETKMANKERKIEVWLIATLSFAK